MKRLLLVLSLLFVALSAVLLCRWRGYFYLTQPPQVGDLVLCEALDEVNHPVNTGNEFKWGTRSVCLLFDYKAFQKDTTLYVRWQYKGHTLAEEQVVLTDESGFCAFYLMKEDGAPLPIGDYSVAVESMGHVLSKAFFVVTR